MTDCNSSCDTPATVDPLNSDITDDHFDETWAYNGIKLFGNLMRQRILRYLKKTKTNGLILKQGNELRARRCQLWWSVCC